MKLDRNTKSQIRKLPKSIKYLPKYGLIHVRKLSTFPTTFTRRDGKVFYEIPAEAVSWGNAPENECFVMMLKDQYANFGLHGYAEHAERDDHEYAQEVRGLANRSGMFHPLCKKPD